MQKNDSFTSQLRGLLTIGLLAGLWLAYSEVRVIFSPEQTWGVLLTPTGVVTLVMYLLLAMVSLGTLTFSLWAQARIQSVADKASSLRWAAVLIVVGLLAWTYLFSTWQVILTGPWTQFLIALGLARLLAWLFAPRRNPPFGWNELVSAFAFFLIPRMIQEARIVFPVEWISQVTLAGGIIFLLILPLLLYGSFPDAFRLKILDLRSRLGGWRTVLAVLVLLAPFVYRYIIGAGGYILYPNIRFAVLLMALWAAAILLCTQTDRLVSLDAVGLSAGWLVIVSAVTRSLLYVVADPFSLSWSEGNRLYDYSLVFGQDLYNYEGVIPDPYNTPGRYGLWGVLFLWRGLPIWAHRLWNIILLTLPPFLLAGALTRNLQPDGWRIGFFLWVTAFFIMIAPLHPPFMIVAIIVAACAFHPSPLVRGASLVAASLYAGLSRWTWVLAPGAWGALIDLLLYYPIRKGNWLRRLWPAALMALLGGLPGFLLNLNNFLGYSTGQVGTAQQPLLWYRLLPNSTLGPGILPLMLLMTGPPVTLLIYRTVARTWKLDGWQLLAVWVALAGFLVAGLVISTKIGGGGDLHNLDMYIGTLMLVTASLLFIKLPDVKTWPAWALALLCLIPFLPAYQFTPFNPSANYHPWLDLPTAQQSAPVLEKIRSAVEDASRHGKVLFMDQRQLLTFGFVDAIPFVPEYEKKYMMDQALASNEAYFKPYYQDLANRRFDLIVTEPLRVNLKEGSGAFSEENDLWVIWVSAPTLCFYESIYTDRVVGVQLLVPRENPTDCGGYLQ